MHAPGRAATTGECVAIRICAVPVAIRSCSTPTSAEAAREGQRRLGLVQHVEAGAVEPRAQHLQERLAMAHLVEVRLAAFPGQGWTPGRCTARASSRRAGSSPSATRPPHARRAASRRAGTRWPGSRGGRGWSRPRRSARRPWRWPRPASTSRCRCRRRGRWPARAPGRRAAAASRPAAHRASRSRRPPLGGPPTRRNGSRRSNGCACHVGPPVSPRLLLATSMPWVAGVPARWRRFSTAGTGWGGGGPT